MSALGQTRLFGDVQDRSASLIGRLGSSTFRLSAAAVSMSLTGSRFSSESAPRPFHHGIRGRGGAIFTAALPSTERHYPPLRWRCRSPARASPRNRHQGPSTMGFEDEVEQSLPRPCGQPNGRSQADLRTHLIRRPARDIIPPLGGARVSFYWI